MYTHSTPIGFHLNRAYRHVCGTSMAKSLRSKRKQKIKRMRKQIFYEKDKAKQQEAMETTEGQFTITNVHAMISVF